MAARKRDTVLIACPDLVYEKAVVETTEQPRKKKPILDPPYNPMGMAILNSARKGMEYQGDTEARNPRAKRMQEAIVDVQKVIHSDEKL